MQSGWTIVFMMMNASKLSLLIDHGISHVMECRRLSPAIGLATAAVFFMAGPVCAAASGTALKLDWDRAVVFHYAALNGDKTRIPQMIQELNEPLEPIYSISILYALSVFGDQRALAAFNSIIATPKDDDLRTYARVAKVRLMAENAAQNITDPSQQAKVKIGRFYQELGLSITQLTSACAAQKASIDSTEVYALEHLADMVYQSGNYAAYAALPEISKIDFTVMPSTNLKMRAAKIDRSQRIAFLIGEMLTEKAGDPESEYRVQLLADFGPAARKAVSAELKKLHEEGPDPRSAPSPWPGVIPGANLLSEVMQISGGPNMNPPLARRGKHDDNAPVSQTRYEVILAY